MATKQMSIDDYLNKGEVAMLDAAPITTDAEKPEPVDYETLNKNELLGVLASKDITIKNYEAVIEDKDLKYKTEIDNLNNYYQAKISELTNLLGYYERKMKLINDILTIESGKGGAK